MAQLRTVKGPDACWVSSPFLFFRWSCVPLALLTCFFNCVFVSRFSRVRACVAASRMGLPPHVLYHGLFVCF